MAFTQGTAFDESPGDRVQRGLCLIEAIGSRALSLDAVPQELNLKVPVRDLSHCKGHRLGKGKS